MPRNPDIPLDWVKAVNPVLRRPMPTNDPDLLRIFNELQAMVVAEANERGPDSRLLGLGLTEDKASAWLKPGAESESLTDDLRQRYGNKVEIVWGLPQP